MTCANRDLLRRISDKWTLFVGAELAAGSSRFGELSRAIPGISKKMLAQTLRYLERDGLIVRTVLPTMPVTVEYALTPLGTTLVAPIKVLTTWAEAHRGEIEQAREEYDHRKLER